MPIITKITLDPEGYIALYFKDFEARAAFLRKHVPAGEPFRAMRFSDDGRRLTWKLSELKAPFDFDFDLGLPPIESGEHPTDCSCLGCEE